MSRRMSKRIGFLTAGVSEKRAKAHRQSKAGTPRDVLVAAPSAVAKRFPRRSGPLELRDFSKHSGETFMADRILTTHVGSLVRPPKLVEFLKAIEAGQPHDKAG